MKRTKRFRYRTRRRARWSCWRDETKQKQLVQQLEDSQLSAAPKAELLTELSTKLEQFQQAANESLGHFL